jgi:predicted MFS family arabinose efflux permease
MYGAIYKFFNVKWTYLAAIFIFEIGSLLSAVAPSSKALIVGRAIAGVSTIIIGNALVSRNPMLTEG